MVYYLISSCCAGFSWADLPRGAVLADVGGGIGSQSILVAQAHTHIQVVVEDREQVVSTARSVRVLYSVFLARSPWLTSDSDQAWGPQYAHLFDSGRMSWRTRDFFEAWHPLALPDPGCVEAPSPAVFLLRMVLHNWNDEDCKRGVYLVLPVATKLTSYTTEY